MLKRIRILLVFLTLVLIGAGCSNLPVGDQTRKAAAGSQVLFADGFSDASSGWSTWSGQDSSVGYQGGGLLFTIQRAGYDYWSRPGRRYADTRIEVDATHVGGPDNNDYGIICRYRNRENFYSFVISSDGYFGILRVLEGAYQVLSGGQMQFSPAVQQGQAANHLRADCRGESLALYANGQLLAEVTDTSFKSGEVGLIAGSYDQPGVEIFFDDFIVLKP